MESQSEAAPTPQVLPCRCAYPRDQACKNEGTTGSNFPDHAGPLTEIVLLGNLAVRTREVIEWDAEQMRVTSVPAANEFLHAEYREGWSL